MNVEEQRQKLIRKSNELAAQFAAICEEIKDGDFRASDEEIRALEVELRELRAVLNSLPIKSK